jgi:hypothetical protein
MFVLQILNNASNVLGLWPQFRKYLFFEVQARIAISYCKQLVAQHRFLWQTLKFETFLYYNILQDHAGKRSLFLLPVRLTAVAIAWRVLSLRIEGRPADIKSTK